LIALVFRRSLHRRRLSAVQGVALAKAPAYQYCTSRVDDLRLLAACVVVLVGVCVGVLLCVSVLLSMILFSCSRVLLVLFAPMLC